MTDQEKAQLLTNYLKETHPWWTYEKSLSVIVDAKGYVEWIAGPNPSIKIIGDTILIEGKDISDNLGTRTTYGDNSPIITNNQGTFNNEFTSSGSNFKDEIAAGVIVLLIGLIITKAFETRFK